MKVVVGDHDIGPVDGYPFDVGTPFSGYLERALDRFGAAVHRQHHVLATQCRQRCAEPAQCFGVECPADQGDGVELGVGACGDLRVSVPEIHRRIRGQAVQVAAPFDIGDP